MKKNKIIYILSIVMLLFAVCMIAYRLIESIVYNINGWYLAIPGPALFNWYDIFLFNMLGDIVFVGPVFLLGVILLIFTNRNQKRK